MSKASAYPHWIHEHSASKPYQFERREPRKRHDVQIDISDSAACGQSDLTQPPVNEWEQHQYPSVPRVMKKLFGRVTGRWVLSVKNFQSR